MPLKANFIERQLINFGIVPWLLLDAGMATMQFQAMIAAMEIGVFKHLKDDPLDIETLLERTGASRTGLQALLNALVGLNYLKAKNGHYELTGAARRSLPIDDLQTMAPFFKDQMLVSGAKAAQGVLEAPPDGVVGWERVQSGPVGRGYQAAMRWLASGLVDEVVGLINLPQSVQRMIDVGGSHGLYTMAFCRKYSGLRGTVLDWPIGLEAAEQTLRENPDVADRIDLVTGDFEREELPGEDYDFAFLGNIVHGVSPECNRELFGKLARATTSAGTVAILDQLAGVSGSKFARGVAALIGFNLFLFSGGRAYAFETLRDWLAEAGFPHVSQRGLRKSPGFSLIIARKQA